VAVKDIINRGLGTPTSLLYFITGGYAIGEATVASFERVKKKARDRRTIVTNLCDTGNDSNG